MTDPRPEKQQGFSTRAQAIVELAVFGSIFIFIVGSIFQQGYSTILYQQSILQPMRAALLKSYMATDKPRMIGSTPLPSTYKFNSAAIFVLQDRLSPGDVKSYGVSDRRPFIMQGGGSFSKGLFYTLDWVDVENPFENAIGVLDVTVNGQKFQFTTAAAYWLIIQQAGMKLYRGDPLIPDPIDPQTVPTGNPCWTGDNYPLPLSDVRQKRLNHEWPNFYGIIANQNTGWNDLNEDWQYDFNRNGDFSDDLFNVAPMDRQQKALWKWIRKTPASVNIEITKDNPTALADVNGDGSEETVYGVFAGTCNGGVYFIKVLDSGAGDVSENSFDGYANLNDKPGLKPDASIYTKLSDGTILEIRNGSAYVLGTNELSASKAMKSQYDVISREWQLNRDMAFPDQFLARQQAGNPGKTVEVQCGSSATLTPSAGASCCTQMANVMMTCFDLSNRRLYIRSRIEDDRGGQWINRPDTSTEAKFVTTP